jgi:PAS domain S-box-containing protein
MQIVWSTSLAAAIFIPHGHCYLWKPGLVWLHIIADGLTALAYYSIPLTLIYFVQKRQDVPFGWMFQCFSAFIIACGTTHMMGIWTIWHPTYWLSGMVKAVTAGVSMYTAIVLIPLVPAALALPSPAQLEAANRELEKEIMERKQAETALKESQRFVQKIADTAPVILYVYDLLEKRNAYINREFTEQLGYPLDEAQSMVEDLPTLIHPDDLPVLQKFVQQWKTVEDGDVLQLEYRMKHCNGNWQYFQCQETVFARTADGAPKQILGAAVDITDRKMIQPLQSALKEKEVLLKEIHHRVKNNLQIVYSLLRLQRRSLTDENAIAALLDSQNRIKAIALLHEKLYRSENLAEIDLPHYISHIATGLFSVYQAYSKSISLETQIAPIPLDIDTAILCGLITNELVSNSLKYAFSNQQTGKIRIDLSQESDHRVHLQISDDGQGLPKDFAQTDSTSLGLKLVTDLVEQLEGSLTIANPAGASFKISFPWRKL